MQVAPATDMMRMEARTENQRPKRNWYQKGLEEVGFEDEAAICVGEGEFGDEMVKEWECINTL